MKNKNKLFEAVEENNVHEKTEKEQTQLPKKRCILLYTNGKWMQDTVIFELILVYLRWKS